METLVSDVPRLKVGDFLQGISSSPSSSLVSDFQRLKVVDFLQGLYSSLLYFSGFLDSSC